MMLTQRLSVLAHDLAKQCQVAGQSKSEEKAKSTFNKKPHHSTEGGESNTETRSKSGGYI